MKRSLPERPSLDQLRRQARELLQQLRTHTPEALDRLRTFHPDFQSLSNSDIEQTPFALHMAQLVIAREYGFASWPRLKQQVELLTLSAQERIEAFVLSSVLDHRTDRPGMFERARSIRRAEPDISTAGFHCALATGDTDYVRSVLQRNPDLARQKGGSKAWEPILYVCYSRWLQETAADRDGKGTVLNSFVEIVRELLKHGADPNSWFAINDDPNARQTCLYGAAGIANHPELTQLLLEAGADPNDGAPGLGPESLYHAAEHASHECLRLLLEAKPHPDKVSYCLGRKLDFEDPEGVRLFLEHGADPNFVTPGRDGSTRLMGAIRNGRSAEVIRLLLEHGGDWRKSDHHGYNAYRLAVRLGHNKAVAIMDELGADPMLAKETDRFLGACMRGDRDQASRLLESHRGMMRSLKTEDTAMIAHAAWLGKHEAVQLMIELGFPVDAFGPEKMTAFHWAAWRGEVDLVEYLIQAGADLEMTNGYGGTVLGCAVYASVHSPFKGDFPAVVRRLIDAGAIVKGRAAWPTRQPAIDALLEPHMDDMPSARRWRHVALLEKPFQTVLQQRPAPVTIGQLTDGWSRLLKEGHARREEWSAIVFKNYSMEWTGRDTAEIFRQELTEEHARDTAARYFGFPSWSNVGSSAGSVLNDSFEKAVDAVVNGNADQLKDLLTTNPSLISERSPFGHRATLLHYTAANGVEIHRQKVPVNAVEILTLLLESGAEVDCLAETYGGGPNQTALCLLITSAHPSEIGLKEAMVEVLLDHGAALEGVDQSGAPLKLAVQFGYTETAALLARHGALARDLATAAAAGASAELERLMAGNPSQKERDEALYLAARHGQLNMVRRMIEAGGDVNARGFFGGTGLHWAAMNGYDKVVQMLVHQGADPGLRDQRFGSTSAGWANEGGNIAIRDWLLDHGCPASIVEAAAFGRVDLVERHLRISPESVHVNEGRTALHEAAGRGHVELVRLLMRAGADPVARDENGLTPIDWAKKSGHTSALKGLMTQNE